MPLKNPENQLQPQVKEERVSKRLIINLDVNGTILAEDSAKGESPIFGALKMIAETLEHEDWRVEKNGTVTKDYKTFVEHSCAHLKKDPSYNAIVQEMFSKLTSAEFILKIGEEKYDQINKDVQKIAAQTGLFPSYQKLFQSLEQSKKPYTIVFHTFGKDVKKVRDTVATMVGMDAANQMPYISFPSVKKYPRLNTIKLDEIPNAEQIKEFLRVENAVFLIKDKLYFGYRNSDQIKEILQTEENDNEIHEPKQPTQAQPKVQAADKRIRALISHSMKGDPSYAQQSRVMRVHAEGATGRAAEAKGPKPKPPNSDIQGYYPIKEVKNIIDYFVQHKLIFAKDSYKEWVKGQLEKGVFTHLGAKPYITGSAENTINFFFDDNVKKRILSVIKDVMIEITDKSTPKQKAEAIQQQTDWVKELVDAGNVVQVTTYEAAIDEDYFIKAVNKVLLEMGEKPLLTTQELAILDNPSEQKNPPETKAAEIENLNKLATAGDPSAQFDMALHFMQGKNVPVNYNRALQYLNNCSGKPTIEEEQGVDLRVILGLYEDEFEKLLMELESMSSSLGKKSKPGKQAAVMELKTELSAIGKTFFQNPKYNTLNKELMSPSLLSVEEIKDFAVACKLKIDKTRDILKIHSNPIYEGILLPLIKGIAGIIAGILIFPVLLSSKIRNEYKDTFFGAPKTPESVGKLKAAEEELDKIERGLTLKKP